MRYEAMQLAASVEPMELLAAAGRIRVAYGFESWDGLRRQFDLPDEAVSAFAEAFHFKGGFELVESHSEEDEAETLVWEWSFDVGYGSYWVVNVEVTRAAFGGVWAVSGIPVWFMSSED